MFHSYNEALEKFFVFEKIGDYSLEKVRKAAQKLGNPQNDYESIHITGTNGKGSVAHMCFEMFKQAGKRVGIFTSPHLVDIRERFQTQDGLISRHEFLECVNQIYCIQEEPFSYFERCTLMAFLYFSKKQCDYGVIEVGCGGALDSTNIITPLVSVITSLGYDHQALLGETLEDIAIQKAGIIKKGRPIILNTPHPIFLKTAKERDAPIIFVEHEKNTNLFGTHQKKNAALAYEVGRYCNIPKDIIYDALMQVKHLGRLDWMGVNLLVDGAHNEAGFQSLFSYIQEYLKKNLFFQKKINVFFHAKTHEKIHLLLNIFGQKNISYCVVNYAHSQLLDPEKISKTYCLPLMTLFDIKTYAHEHKNTLCVVCGSLYMIGGLYKN